jgi:predicted nucleic acid-binding protein
VTACDAVLDTCVLFPITLADTLLRLAEADFFRPHWSQETLDELIRNFVDKAGLNTSAAQRRWSHDCSFPEALVDGYQRLVPAMPNDPKDRHVLAAAVRSGSQTIVTSNLSDFPPKLLHEFGVEARPAAAAVLRQQAADRIRPPQSPAEVLARLTINAPAFAHEMRRALGLPA